MRRTTLVANAAVLLQRCSDATYQEDVVKDFRRTVHLAQNGNHLIVDELLKLSQVARHVHFQLCSYLHNTSSQRTDQHTDKILKQQKLKWQPFLFGRDPSCCKNTNFSHECICSEHLQIQHLTRSLTSLQVTFSRSFCIMISLKLVLI